MPYAVVDFFDADSGEHLCVAGPFKPRPGEINDQQLIHEGVAIVIEGGQLDPEEAHAAKKMLRFVELKT